MHDVATDNPPAPHHYEAMSRGARCEVCPLRNLGEGPVPSTLPLGPGGHHPFVVIAEAPGHNEVAEGRTLIGASGREVRNALRQAGADVDQVAFTNAIMCRPPGGDLKRYLQYTVKKNKLPSPFDACRPRLKAEIANAKFALLMGGASLTGVGINSTVMKLRGTPVQIPDGPRAIPTPHAAFVMRDEGRVMRPIFHADIRKAVRFAAGGDTWREPRYFVPQSSDQVANFLATMQGRVATDVETDGVDQWTCGLRRVGIGNDREVMIYSPLSVHGHSMLPQHEVQAQTRAIGDFFQRFPRFDLHNGVSFDSVVLWRHGMPLVDQKTFDTLVGHQIGMTSELQHSLDFLGSIYTDAPRWKDDVKHSNVKSDAVLDRYLSYDIAVTYQSAPFVEQNLISSQQTHVYTIDKELFEIGRSMSALGIRIDPERRLKFAKEYQEKSDRLKNEFITVAGRDINPGSYPQIRKLLYEDLGLTMLEEHMTDAGEPSTDESTLLDLLSMGVDKRAEQVIHALIGYREAEKILGTNTGHVVDGKIEGGPPVHTDGRVRTNWRPGKRSGRWSSSDPINAQNIANRLRAMFVPHPGNVFVAADMCLVGETNVITVDGLKQIRDICVGDGVLSVAVGQKPAFKRVERVQCVGTAMIYEMLLDDGTSVKCTAEHKWMRKNGEMCRTDELKPDDRLAHVMDGHGGPRGYPTWYIGSHFNYVLKHKAVAAFSLGPPPAGHEVDHQDGNRSNWTRRNLKWLPKSANRAQGGARQWARASTEGRKTIIERLHAGMRKNRRSYAGEGNPNHGKRKGEPHACLACQAMFYAPPSQKKMFCSRTCFFSLKKGAPRDKSFRPNNHRVVAIKFAGWDPVYQIQVADWHTFVLENGLVSGNSAVELRKIALLSGDKPLIEAFRLFDDGKGPDVHIANACGVFRCTPEQVTKPIRDFIKRFVYALSYDAQPPKIYQTLSLLRDDNLRPLFPHITLPEVERIYNLWWQLHPAIPEWKKNLVYFWRRHGYIETAYHKRRRYFLGGEKAEEIGNHPVQGASADMQNDSIRALVRAYPFDFANHRGLVVNGHDQLVVECAAREAEDVKRLVEQVMNKQIGPMKFPAQAKAAGDWKAVS